MALEPSWRLPDHVHAAAVGDDLVLLDVAADAYYALPGRGPALGLQRDRAAVRPDGALARALADAGLLVADDGVPRRRRTARRPAACLLPDSAEAPRWGDLGALGACAMDALARYRRRSFADLVAWAEGGRAAGEGAPASAAPGLVAAVADFHRWIAFAPVGGKCLLRSFLLLRHLRRQGLDADWVIGVSTWPFRAHCWLQAGDLALDESVERIAAFQPILVL